MTLTYEDIRARIDLGQIHRAGQWAARRFAEGEEVAHVKLTPGDGTVYQIVIQRSDVWTEEMTVIPRDYIVTVVGSIGDSYQWAGQQLHPDYVGEKWTPDGNKWTATVVAEFLNAFSLARGTGVA
jgi:hypothetical protein